MVLEMEANINCDKSRFYVGMLEIKHMFFKINKSVVFSEGVFRYVTFWV